MTPDPKSPLPTMGPGVQIQPVPVVEWQVSTPPGLKLGHRLMIAVTPFGPNVYELNTQDALALSRALAAPHIQVPTI